MLVIAVRGPLPSPQQAAAVPGTEAHPSWTRCQPALSTLGSQGPCVQAGPTSYNKVQRARPRGVRDSVSVYGTVRETLGFILSSPVGRCSSPTMAGVPRSVSPLVSDDTHVAVSVGAETCFVACLTVLTRVQIAFCPHMNRAPPIFSSIITSRRGPMLMAGAAQNARHTQLLCAVLLVTSWLPRSLSHSITSTQCVLVACACGPLNVASRHAPVFVRRCRRHDG